MEESQEDWVGLLKVFRAEEIDRLKHQLQSSRQETSIKKRPILQDILSARKNMRRKINESVAETDANLDRGLQSTKDLMALAKDYFDGTTTECITPLSIATKWGKALEGDSEFRRFYSNSRESLQSKTIGGVSCFSKRDL